jgi:hypothetical protein
LSTNTELSKEGEDEKREYMNFLNGLLFLDEEQGEGEEEDDDDDEDFRPGYSGKGGGGGGGTTSDDEDEDEDDEDEEDDEDDDEDDDETETEDEDEVTRRRGRRRKRKEPRVKKNARGEEGDDIGDEEDYDLVGATELKDLLLGSLEAMTGEFPAQNRHDMSERSISLSNASADSLFNSDSPLRRKSSPVSTPEVANLKALSPLHPFRTNQIPRQGASVITSLASQLFSGDRRGAEDMLIEGMPVGALRKLIARQNSMASQLLVQTVLQASHRVSNYTFFFRNCLCFIFFLPSRANLSNFINSDFYSFA